MAVYPERRKGRLTGKWIAEVVVHGRRQRPRFDTKKEADQWEGIAKLTGELPTVFEKPSVPVGPTFGEVAKDMLAAKPNHDKSGSARLSYVIEEIGRNTPISDVDTTKLDKLVQSLRSRPGKQLEKLTPGTINRYLSEASGVLNFGRARGYVKAMPVIPWQEDDGKRIHWLTEEEEEKIVKTLEAEGETACAQVVRILTETGMRWGEFASITAEQVEPETGWIRLWKTKNGDVRSVPVSFGTAVILKRMIENKTRPDYYTFRTRLKDAAKSAGKSDAFSIHALRHTTATRLIAKGVPLPIVQKYLGHKTIQTTMKYVHVADEDLQTALEKISPRAGRLAVVAKN